MYANLAVKIHLEGEDDVVYAWKIEKRNDQLRIHTDENDGESNHAVEGGIITIPATDLLEVAASF